MELLNDDELFESDINFKGEYINTLTQEQIEEAVKKYFEENNVAPKAKTKEVTIFANKWDKINNRVYEQIIAIDEVTENSQVDLTPSDEQLNIFYDKKVMLTTKNMGGTVTVVLIGDKLTDDYNIQVTITEVEHE